MSPVVPSLAATPPPALILTPRKAFFPLFIPSIQIKQLLNHLHCRGGSRVGKVCGGGSTLLPLPPRVWPIQQAWHCHGVWRSFASPRFWTRTPFKKKKKFFSTRTSAAVFDVDEDVLYGPSCMRCGRRTILPHKESYDDWGEGVHATTPGTRKSRRLTCAASCTMYYVY